MIVQNGIVLIQNFRRIVLIATFLFRIFFDLCAIEDIMNFEIV